MPIKTPRQWKTPERKEELRAEAESLADVAHEVRALFDDLQRAAWEGIEGGLN